MTPQPPSLPEDILLGMPVPRRGRWQPLRAAIAGIFRYDSQEFVFFNGRLLLRGNNGNGKSMALEVLLPFVLDADLSPERLSTFGGRSRRMYTWLLGHDDTKGRDSARGYVWVEFGRIGPLGTAEYFTVGAGLETNRTNQEVQPWYFSTAARVGIDFVLTEVGTEAPKKDVLEQRLAGCAADGLDGQVHPDPDTHRTKVNQVLFGLARHKFDALRKALLQLRRPKLSDKLSERGLAEILRDSLAPLDTHLIESIARGYERLDRHHGDIKSMRDTLDALQALEKRYTDYARAALLLRATTVLDTAEATARAVSATQAEAGEHIRLTAQASDLAATIEATKADIARLEGHLNGLKLRETFTKGADLEPSREQAEQMERAATASAHRAEGAREQADAEEDAARDLADERETARAAVTSTRRLADEAALVPSLILQPHRQWIAQLDLLPDSSGDDDIERLRLQLRDEATALRTSVSELLRLVGEADQAVAKAEGAGVEVTSARAELDVAKRTAEHAETNLNEARRAQRALLQDWLSCSSQLCQGLAPPVLDEETARLEVKSWARQASEARTSQVEVMQEQIRQASADQGLLAAGLATFQDAVEVAATALTQADAAHQAAADADAAWCERVERWYTSLTELIQAGLQWRTPRLDEADQWHERITDAARDHACRIGERRREVAGRRSAINRHRTDLHDTRKPLSDEREQLQSGQLVPPAPSPTRLADRHDRAGAPLYLLIDFVDEHLDRRRAANLEASLLASGLADAWVSPTGQILSGSDGPLTDTQLVSRTGPVARSPLSSALRPDELGSATAGVPDAVITDLLDRIELADTAASSSSGQGIVVAWDGSWRTGALYGAYAQTAAGLVGASSRETRRQARLLELDEQIGHIDAQISALTGEDERLAAEDASLERATTQLEQETDSLDSPDPARRAAEEAMGASRRAHDALASVARSHVALLRQEAIAMSRAESALSSAAAGTLNSGQNDSPETDLPSIAIPAETAPFKSFADTVQQDGAAVVESIRSQLATASEHLDGHRADLERELSELGELLTRDELDRAGTAVVEAEKACRAAREKLEATLGAQSDAHRFADEQRTIRDAALATAGLSHPGQVEELPQTIQSWHNHAEDLLRCTQLATRTSIASNQATQRAAQARSQVNEANSVAEADQGAATAARARYEALRQRLGAPYAAIISEIQQTDGQLTAKGKAVQDWTTQHTQLQNQIGAAKVKTQNAEAKQRELQERIPRTCEALVAACAADLPAAADWPAPADVTEFDTDGLVATAQLIVDAAGRRAHGERATGDLDAAMNATSKARHDADVTLAGQFTLIERWSEGLLLVETIRHGQTRTLAATIKEIRINLIAAETVLQRDEAELLEQFLTDDVRKQVVARIEAARGQIKTMNTLMERHPMTSGLQIQLAWRPDPDAGIGHDVIDLLDADFDAAPSARTRLRGFFEDRIATIRATRTGRTWPELLGEMLDYRRWYRFDINAKQAAGEWSRLSSSAHSALSGGEKSIALHLPLFTAAATHTVASTIRDTTDSNLPGCPRLILLDEIFAGVDEDNRGSLFEAIRTLDMDLIATSESETGMYAEIDGIAVYHLIRSQGLPGVLAARSVWDGKQQHDLLDTDLERTG